MLILLGIAGVYPIFFYPASALGVESIYPSNATSGADPNLDDILLASASAADLV